MMREIYLPKEAFGMLVMAVTTVETNWDFTTQKITAKEMPDHLAGKRVLTYSDVRYVEE